MQKIVPHLWFTDQARQAADFYTGLFPDSQITNITTLHDTPSGDCDIVLFALSGYSFMAISGGPLFRFNPSISFMVNFDPSQDSQAEKRLNALWAGLSDGGTVLMSLDKYPFSKRYGWIADKYGLSWQLILTNPQGDRRPPVIPFFLFVGDVYGKAKSASDFYLEVFDNSKRGLITSYPAGMEPDKEGATMFTDFRLENQWFAASDSAHMHDFSFNEAVSLIVRCDNQAEIDYFWDKLSADPGAEQCGWLKDRYGVSWQIVPVELDEMMSTGTPDQIARVTQAFLPMKKFDIAILKKAYRGG